MQTTELFAGPSDDRTKWGNKVHDRESRLSTTCVKLLLALFVIDDQSFHHNNNTPATR